jgi:hypothetical protein
VLAAEGIAGRRGPGLLQSPPLRITTIIVHLVGSAGLVAGGGLKGLALLSRIYYNAVFGGLGGLLGWMLFGVFGGRNVVKVHWFSLLGWELTTEDRHILLGGLLIGGAIGYLVVAVEAIRDRALLRFVRLAAYGVLLGAIGGALGIWLGDKINTALVGRLGANRGSALVFFGTMFARGLGWMFLGVAIGVSEAVAARSLGKLSYSILGGAIGGFVGGALFALAYLLTLERTADAVLWGALGLIVLGACIGSLSALVQSVFQPASVKVLRGWQEGREYPLEKPQNLLGREEHADIALFRDMRVEKQHAWIRRDGPNYVLVNNNAPPDFTRVNDEPVYGSRELHDGDRIQLGNVVLRFQARAAQNRPRPPRVPGGV